MLLATMTQVAEFQALQSVYSEAGAVEEDVEGLLQQAQRVWAMIDCVSHKSEGSRRPCKPFTTAFTTALFTWKEQALTTFTQPLKHRCACIYCRDNADHCHIEGFVLVSCSAGAGVRAKCCRCCSAAQRPCAPDRRGGAWRRAPVAALLAAARLPLFSWPSAAGAPFPGQEACSHSPLM